MHRSNRKSCRADPDTALNSDALLSLSGAMSLIAAASLIARNGRELKVPLRD